MPSDLVIVYHRQPYEEVEENGQIVLKENKRPNGLEARRGSGQPGFRAAHRDQ